MPIDGFAVAGNTRVHKVLHPGGGNAGKDQALDDREFDIMGTVER